MAAQGGTHHGMREPERRGAGAAAGAGSKAGVSRSPVHTRLAIAGIALLLLLVGMAGLHRAGLLGSGWFAGGSDPYADRYATGDPSAAGGAQNTGFSFFFWRRWTRAAPGRHGGSRDPSVGRPGGPTPNKTLQPVSPPTADRWGFAPAQSGPATFSGVSGVATPSGGGQQAEAAGGRPALTAAGGDSRSLAPVPEVQGVAVGANPRYVARPSAQWLTGPSAGDVSIVAAPPEDLSTLRPGVRDALPPPNPTITVRTFTPGPVSGEKAPPPAQPPPAPLPVASPARKCVSWVSCAMESVVDYLQGKASGAGDGGSDGANRDAPGAR